MNLTQGNAGFNGGEAVFLPADGRGMTQKGKNKIRGMMGRGISGKDNLKIVFELAEKNGFLEYSQKAHGYWVELVK